MSLLRPVAARFNASMESRLICGSEVFRLLFFATMTPRNHHPLRAASLRKTFRKLVNEYGGATSVVEVLRYAPGFKDFNRTTVYRWMGARGPGATMDLDKAARAVDFLRAWNTTLKLKIAIPDTLQSLPALMLTWSDVWKNRTRLGVKENSPYGLLERKGITVDPQPCSGGYEALSLLRSNPLFDLALAARDFQVSPPVYRLSRIGRAEWYGIAKRELHSIGDLDGKTVAYHRDTAIPLKLNTIEERTGIVISRKPVVETNELIQSLKDDEKLIALGWEPFLTEINDRFEKKFGYRLVNFRLADSDHAAYAVDVDLFVRKEDANPEAVRVFLDALDQANRYVARQSNRDEIASVCLGKLESWKLHRWMVDQALEGSINYQIDQLEPEVVRYLWTKEVAAEKASKQK
jgi:hypothetical protein